MKTIPLFSEILRGVHHIEPCRDGVMLQRFPASVLRLYQDMESRMVRVQAPSGVRIVFETDSPVVRLRHTFGRPAREIYAFDVFLDDAAAPFAAADGVLDVPLPGGRHKVEILVPHLVECCFGDLEVADGCSVFPASPAENPRKLLFVGDSIMQGMTTSTPGRTYADQLARAGKMDYYNLGIGGITADPAWGALIAREYEYSQVIFGIGTNDFCLEKRLADYRRDMTEFLSHFAGKPMIMLSMTPFFDRAQFNQAGESLDSFRDCVRELASARPDTVYVHGPDLLPEDRQYLIDGLHPNDLGAELFFRNLQKFL